ncbi:MAG TPA: hypothetical protein VI757_04140 [Bacteroidia bacterium]|nr:hypothetical protein [Bacteroidia bacterium]
MAFQDVIQLHFTDLEKTQAETLMGQLEALLQPKLRNLSETENNTYGTINEKNKLLVNKVKDYRDTQPALSSPDVDWTEFGSDFDDRSFLSTSALRLDGLSKAFTETRRLHDYDNFQNSLIDYDYTLYKDRTSPGLGYDSKAAELKQFFVP